LFLKLLKSSMNKTSKTGQKRLIFLMVKQTLYYRHATHPMPKHHQSFRIKYASRFYSMSFEVLRSHYRLVLLQWYLELFAVCRSCVLYAWQKSNAFPNESKLGPYIWKAWFWYSAYLCLGSVSFLYNINFKFFYFF
jgi:hypothetical protein